MERTEEEVLLSLVEPVLAPAVRKIIAERDELKRLLSERTLHDSYCHLSDNIVLPLTITPGRRGNPF